VIAYRQKASIGRVFRLAAPALCLALGSGCGSVIPKDGPAANAFTANASAELGAPAQSLDYVLVSMSSPVVNAANRNADAGSGFASFARSRAPSQALVAVGDVLSITVFEATAGGLFLPTDAGSRNGNYVTIPNEQVDSSGTISTPYASSPISVVGKTPQRIGADIAAMLAKRAIEPQVVVTIVDRRSNEVSVLGDVNLPQRFALDPGGIRVLDALARAGGPKDPAYETTVTVQRRGHTERAPMTAMVKSPAQNIELRAGDVVYVAHDPKIFMTLGATLPPGSVGGINNRRFPFDNETETLSEALAKSGGLDDTRADTRAVFLYRLESRKTLAEMGVDVAKYETPLVPTIYSVDLSRPDGFFLTSAFQMRNNDFIFVSNSLTPDLNKLLGTVRNVTGPVYDAAQSRAAILNP